MENRLVSFGLEPTVSPNRLVHGDNLHLLESLEDESIDLVYVDPPFGTGKVRRGGNEQTLAPTSWRDVPGDPEQFILWIQPRLEHTRRLLAKTGSLFVHLDYRAVHYVKVALDRLFGAGCFVNEIIWCYSVGGKSRRTFGRKHDTILWYGRSKDYAFYPDEIRVPRKSGSHMKLVDGPDGQPVQEKRDRKTGKIYRYPVAAGKVPEDWWIDIETLNRSDRERTGWATQKPERLLQRIERATTVAGDVVADWFCGSGTTAVVAQQLGRRFITSDAQPNAIDCAATRLEVGGKLLAASGAPPRDILIESCGPELP